MRARVRGGQACLAVMAASGGLAELSRKHGVKVGSGSGCWRANRAQPCKVCRPYEQGGGMLSLERVEQVDRLVEAGISVNGLFVQVTPLMQPAARITLSNVPPFISGEFLIKELCRNTAK